ncbi:beta strand repeat-containing protein [Ferruginibacter profundus]
MKSVTCFLLSSLALLLLLPAKGFTQNVTLTTAATAAANLLQGTNTNPIAYAVKMDIGASPVTVTSIQFTLSGTHDNNDINSIGIWFNATTPSIAGATLLNTATVGFAAPHTYSVSFSVPLAAGASGYFMVSTNITSTATSGNTVKANGAANPAVFGFTAGQVVTNNQTDIAGLLTIVAGTATLTSSPVAAGNIAQGSSANSIVYAVKMDITAFPVTVNNIQFVLGGTYDNNDISSIGVWFNATTPSVSGASLLNSLSGGFAGPHTYSTAASIPIAAGASGYFIISVNLSVGATAGNTFKIDGAINPIVFGFTAAPTVVNNQADAAGTQTIVAAAATLTTTALTAANISQGSNFNPVYVVKVDITALPVTVNSIQFTLTGTHDANDLTVATVWFNATTPTVAGASALVNTSGLFAAPHTYTVAVTQNMAAGASGYFIITVTTAAAATTGNTIKSDGAANPVVFGFTTAPTITNNQTDIAGIQTILAANTTLTSAAVAASNIAQGTTFNPVYAVKMEVTTLPVTVNNIQFTLTGTHDNNDLSVVTVWFNATAPTVSGAGALVNLTGTFAAPHTYSTGAIATTIAAGASGYFIITVTTAAGATSGNTVKLDGAANPVVFSFLTSPTITNNQTDAAGIQTILAAGATLTTIPVAAANILQGTTFNPVYIVKMDISNLPVTVNNIQFTLSGTHDNNDLSVVTAWYNPVAPTVTGATGLVNLTGTFAAPHTYSTGTLSTLIAAGASGYFIITVTTAAGATVGNTVKSDGAVNPAIFSFTTAPPITNNQTDLGGIQTITSTLPLKLLGFTGAITSSQGSQLQWVTAGELNVKDFEIEWSEDGLGFNKIATIPAVNSSQDRHYNYLHQLPVDGNNFYRLKMNDKDGQFTFSPVIKINVPVTTGKIVVLQNPVTDLLKFQVRALKNETIVLYLYSTDGKNMATKSFSVLKGNNQLSWDLHQLAEGMYFMRTGKNIFETIKIIKD